MLGAISPVHVIKGKLTHFRRMSGCTSDVERIYNAEITEERRDEETFSKPSWWWFAETGFPLVAVSVSSSNTTTTRADIGIGNCGPSGKCNEHMRPGAKLDGVRGTGADGGTWYGPMVVQGV